MTTNTKPAETGIARGLEGIVISESRLSYINGQEGRLGYVGYSIDDLAEHASFEEVCFLLWHLRLPKRAELEALKADLRKHRALEPEALKLLRLIPTDANPMSVLRTTVSLLSSFERGKWVSNPQEDLRRAVLMTAKFPTIVAAFDRLRKGKEPVAPHKSLDHTANFLYMLHGAEPTELAARVLDMGLVLHADHGLNASTFAALVTGSTLSDLYSSVVSGIGTLKGPLHGGANEEVLDMIKEIGSADRVEAFLDDAKKTKRKIMGFGHRVYKAYDPRAVILKKWAEKLSKGTEYEDYFKMTEELEKAMLRRYSEKGIFPNVDLYSGIVYHQLGIEGDLFTPIFAIARVPGWTAHVLEYWKDNRLFRPKAKYVGPPLQAYVPIEKR